MSFFPIHIILWGLDFRGWNDDAACGIRGIRVNIIRINFFNPPLKYIHFLLSFFTSLLQIQYGLDVIMDQEILKGLVCCLVNNFLLGFVGIVSVFSIHWARFIRFETFLLIKVESWKCLDLVIIYSFYFPVNAHLIDPRNSFNNLESKQTYVYLNS